MSSTQTNESNGKIDLKLEVAVVPVDDVDRAKKFYAGLGWRVDIDVAHGDTFRGVQVTPPNSHSSIIFGKNLTPAAPGSVQGLILVVDAIEAARGDLLAHGVEASSPFHFADGALHVGESKDRAAGPDPQRRPYFTWASFSDPDGNGWLLQEVQMRAPGRLWPDQREIDVSALTDLLREAEERHGEYERTAPKHHWSGWYAAYLAARQQGASADAAATRAALHLKRA